VAGADGAGRPKLGVVRIYTDIRILAQNLRNKQVYAVQGRKKAIRFQIIGDDAHAVSPSVGCELGACLRQTAIELRDLSQFPPAGIPLHSGGAARHYNYISRNVAEAGVKAAQGRRVV